MVIIPEEELDNKIFVQVSRALQQFNAEQTSQSGEKLYTINQIAKLTGKSHAGIRALVDKGIIKSNKANLISESSLKEFLEMK